MSDVDRVTSLAVGWALALALLAFTWARTPLSGSGPAFLIWCAPGALLAALSWSWLRRADVPALRIASRQAALGALFWIALVALVATGTGDEWTLDGLILRNTLERIAGIGLRWAPGVWAGVVSVAGLAAALEARYRLTQPAEDASPSGAQPQEESAAG